jgi:undecaprenyl-diphosphatase
MTAMFRFIESRDLSLMRSVNRWSPPQWFRVWMMCATRAGDGWLWYSLGLVILIVGGPVRFRAIGAATLAVGSGIILFRQLKRWIGRKRPCALAPRLWATALLPPDRFSFPSGHTITAFAVAVSLSAFYPSLLAGLLFCAISIAASRVLLGMHFLSDVLAGALIGSSLACAAVQLLR